MRSSILPLAAAMLGAATFAAAPSGLSCSLEPPDALQLKTAMAREIAFRLALDVAQFSLDDITTPQLHQPLPLGADCSGLAAVHHSSGFRIAVARQQRSFATMAKPPTAAGAGARARARYASGFYNRWPGAGVRRNFWRAPKPKPESVPDFSGYQRWPQYPTERDFAQAVPRGPAHPHRWPQYPTERDFVQAVPRGPAHPWQRWPQHPDETESTGEPRAPERWTTLGVQPRQVPPGFCHYEGMAVVLGYSPASPVAVNFRQHCD